MPESLLLSDEMNLAQQMVDRFVLRYEPSYRALLYHAALPLVLTPDLLSYLRSKFLQGEVPWIAEADLLLSELCQQVGYEQYAMTSAVRAYLLHEMKQDPAFGAARMEAVARLLIHYVRHLAHNSAFVLDHQLQAQQWAAMVYLSGQSEVAVKEIAEAIRDSIQPSDAENLAATVSCSEIARLTELVRSLAPALESYPELLGYAADVAALLANTSAQVEDRLGATGELLREIEVRSVRLPPLELLLARQHRSPTVSIRSRWAVLVGPGVHTDGRIPGSPTAIADVDLLKSVLTRGGFPEQHVLTAAGPTLSRCCWPHPAPRPGWC